MNRLHIENPLLLGFLVVVSAGFFGLAISIHPRESAISHAIVAVGLLSGLLATYGAARRCRGDALRVLVFVAGGVALRLLLIWLTRGTSDTRAMVIIGELVETGGTPYEPITSAGPYAYSPVFGWLMLAVRRAALATGLRLEAAVKLPSLICDLVVLLILLKVALRHELDARRKTDLMAVYFLNPIIVLVHAWHAQFGGLALVFLLLAYLEAAQKGRLSPRAILCLCLAVWVKQFTILFVIPFLIWERSWPRRIVAAVLPPLGFVLLLIPYGEHAFRNVGSYHSIVGGYGFSQLSLIFGLPVSSKVASVWAKGLLVCVPLVVWIGQLRGASLLKMILLSILSFFVFTPGFAAQYYLWPLVLGALLVESRRRWLLIYIAVGTCFYLAYFCYWPKTTLLINMLTFGFMVTWLVYELRRGAPPLPDWLPTKADPATASAPERSA